MFLVTGAAGFLGLQIVSCLLCRGEKVRALVLPGDPLASKLPEEVEIVYGDLLNDADLARFFESGTAPRFLIHCASIITMSMTPVEPVYQVNVTGTEKLIERCLKTGVKAMLHVASVHAITEKPGKAVMTEPSSVSPDSVVGYYAKTKAMAVSRVMKAREEKGLCASIVYPAGLCGPGDHGQGNLSQMFLDYMDGRIPVGVSGGYNFVDVRDVAQAIVALATGNLWGEDFLLSGSYVSIMDILDGFHRVTGAKKIRLRIPLWLAKLFLPVMALTYKFRKSRPVFSAYSLHTIQANSNFDSQKARVMLGFEPRPIAETLEDTARFWMERKEKRSS